MQNAEMNEKLKRFLSLLEDFVDLMDIDDAEDEKDDDKKKEEK